MSYTSEETRQAFAAWEKYLPTAARTFAGLEPSTAGSVWTILDNPIAGLIYAAGYLAGKRAAVVTPPAEDTPKSSSRVYKCNNCKEQAQHTDAGACLVCGWNESLRCIENSHGNTHCWHWRGQPPTPQTEVQAACCWCGAVRAFGYDAVLDGRAPRSPSPGAIHGIATELPKREVREQYRIAAKEPLIVGVTTLENPGVGLPPGFGEAITYHTTRLTQARDVDRGTAAPAQPGEAVQGT